MDSEIFSKAIYFPLAPKHSQPEILKGSSHFTSLPAIFAVLMTGQCRGDQGTRYQTDQRGLEALASAARDASGEINDAIMAISKLGAYSNQRDLDEWTGVSLFWTFNRLAELREVLDSAAEDFESALERDGFLPVKLENYQAATSEGGHHD